VPGYRDHAVSLTKDGRSLLESHRDHEHEHSQTFYAGLGRERELEHDLQVYRAYEQAQDRLLDCGGHIERVVLDHELKSEYQRWLHERDKDHDDYDGHPDRTPDEIREWAYEHALPYFDDEVHFPDVRVEYQEPDGRWEREDIEVVTPALSRRPWCERGALGLLLLSRVEPARLDQRRRATRRAQRRPGRGALAMTQEERIRAVVDCGFTERQARFLVLVMCHGGICIPRQYASFAGIANGGRRCNAFFDKLVKRGYAHEIRCVHNRARVYHVHHKPLYFLIGEASSRYRRPVSPRVAVERLMLLDAVLDVGDVEWLTTAAEKAVYLEGLKAKATDDGPQEPTSDEARPRLSSLPRPRRPPRSVTPRAAQGSFTPRFRVSCSEREGGRLRVRSRAVARPEAAREAVSFRPDE
jgi:hypothetical protein